MKKRIKKTLLNIIKRRSEFLLTPISPTVCVEAGSVAEWQTLKPGETWEGGVVAKAHI